MLVLSFRIVVLWILFFRGIIAAGAFRLCVISAKGFQNSLIRVFTLVIPQFLTQNLMIYQQLWVTVNSQRAVPALSVWLHRLRALSLMISAFFWLVSIKFLSTTLTIKYLMISGDMLRELVLILEPQFTVFAGEEKIWGLVFEHKRWFGARCNVR